jgi:alpha-N-arabinofuranosidase
LKIRRLEENFNRTQREYFFLRLPNRYDKYDRKGPEIIVGQYSLKETGQSKNDAKNNQGNLMAAVVEAAFLTGCERNSDIVVSTNFGTLSANINAPQNSGPCLFYNNSVSNFAIPSYYMLKMFIENTGDVILPYTLSLGVLSNSLYVAPSKVNSNGDIIIKVVNTTEKISDTKIILKGTMNKIDTNIQVTTLSSGDPSDENSIAKPLKVIPIVSTFTIPGTITDSGNSFNFPFPAGSVSVLRIKISKESDEK